MGTPMEGFFDGAEVVAKAMAIATLATTQAVPAETSIPSTEPVPVDEGTHTERVTLQKGATPPAASQTEVFFPATPLIISTSDPFVALS